MLISKKKRRRAALGSFLIFSLVILATTFFVTDLSYTAPELNIKTTRSSLVSKRQEVQLTPFLTKSSSFRPLSVEAMASQIVIESVNTRPDSAFIPLLAMAKIVKSGQSLPLMQQQQRVYLAINQRQSLEISDEPSALYITHNKDSRAQSPFSLHYINHLGEEEQVVLKCRQSMPLKKNGNNALFEGSKLLDPDQLVQSYSTESKRLASKRLCLVSEGKSLCVPIKESDCFVQEVQGWVKMSPGQASANKPLLQVKSIKDHEALLHFWLQGDLEPQPVIVAKYQEKPITFNPSQSISEVKRRALSTISCRFNKKLHVFKLGDWVIEGEQGWHLVKHVEELDKIVEGQVMGSLMVFEELVQNGGKKTVVGKVFSPYRTLCTPFALELGKKDKGKRNPRVPERNSSKRGGYNRAGRKTKR